jgi:glycyl-tRNA synthetase beta chain
MQKNQKYFALVDKFAALLPNCLVVSNIEVERPDQIVSGNARVLRARLADARFFFEQDRKMALADRVPRLANVVYHNKLGSQMDRMQRVQKLGLEIGQSLGAKSSAVERAAYLGKADLLTDMVGEFPELQGTMGYYYASHDGELPVVAGALVEQYFPRFSGSGLPRTPEGNSIAIADKLDTLVGIYGIGLVPTGEKDPYGLRRAAVGIIRILIENDLALDLRELLMTASSQFPNGLLKETVVQDLYGYFLDRLRPYLRDRNFAADEIEAVLALEPTRLDEVMKRLQALREFRKLPAAESLAAANKRIRNILKQAGGAANGAFDPDLSVQDEERTLGERVAAIKGEVETAFANTDYEGGLKKLAGLRPAVDAFFDKVLVMHEDEAIRKNRLALLAGLSNLFLGVADISRLQS